MDYALAIHTTTSDLGLALSNFQTDSRSQVWELNRELSSHLHLYLTEFLQPQRWSDLRFLAVAKGPGGYTGTRIGVVTARTLAQQLNIPLFAVSSLAAVVWQQGTQAIADFKGDWAIQMPAQRGELYTAIYAPAASSNGLSAKLADSVMTPEQWQQTLDLWGRPFRLLNAEGTLGRTVESVLALANLSWQQGERPQWQDALPFYGQLYVAEPKPATPGR